MTATANNQSAVDDQASLWRSWFEAAAQPDVDAEIRDLFARLDKAIQSRGPTCWTSGKCCKFDEYGHKLYVTGLEIAWVLKQVKSDKSQVISDKSNSNSLGLRVLPVSSHLSPVTRHLSLPSACVYQVDGLCSIHAVRPMGCHVFFCQQGTAEWQRELYEHFLAELRGMHDRRGLPYRYMEWRHGLHEAGLAKP